MSQPAQEINIQPEAQHQEHVEQHEEKTTFLDYVYIVLLSLLTYGIMIGLYAGLHFYTLYDYYWCFGTQMIWFGIFFFSFLTIWHYAYKNAKSQDIAKKMIEENLKKQGE